MSGRLHMRAVAAMSLGGLLFGFDTAVISGVTTAITGAFRLSAAGLGWAVSAALWGTLIGALASGAPGDRWGSLMVLRGVGLAYVASAIGCALADTLTLFAAFRFLGGLAIGASSVLVPVYIAEISPAERRGLLVGLFQFNIVLGILIAYLSNALVDAASTAELAWRWKLGVAAAPAVLFMLLLAGLPQSPRWLRAKGREAAAADAAARLGLAVETPLPAGESGRLRWRRHRKPILLAVAIGLFNQMSGINAILYYLNDIFVGAGFAGLSANAQAVVVGIANLIATMIGLALIDRLGRKPLLIGGGCVTAAALAGVALVYQGVGSTTWLLPLLVVFITAFAMSQGAVIWVYLSEIFPTDVRARGHSIGSATHWVANAAISLAFPVIAAWSQPAPFWFFAAAMLVQAVIILVVFPETRRQDLEAISANLATR